MKAKWYITVAEKILVSVIWKVKAENEIKKTVTKMSMLAFRPNLLTFMTP
jgi:hypothetical protein